MEQSYENLIRSQADTDSFLQLSKLTLTQARTQIKNGFENNIKSLEMIGPANIVLKIGQSIQYRVLAHRSIDGINVPTLGAATQDVTTSVSWEVSADNVISVINGFVTGVGVGNIELFAKKAGFETTVILIGVQA